MTRGRVGVLVTVEVEGVDFADRAGAAVNAIRRALGSPAGAYVSELVVTDVSEISTAALNGALTVGVPEERI